MSGDTAKVLTHRLLLALGTNGTTDRIPHLRDSASDDSCNSTTNSASTSWDSWRLGRRALRRAAPCRLHTWRRPVDRSRADGRQRGGRTKRRLDLLERRRCRSRSCRRCLLPFSSGRSRPGIVTPLRCWATRDCSLRSTLTARRVSSLRATRVPDSSRARPQGSSRRGSSVSLRPHFGALMIATLGAAFVAEALDMFFAAVTARIRGSNASGGCCDARHRFCSPRSRCTRPPLPMLALRVYAVLAVDSAALLHSSARCPEPLRHVSAAATARRGSEASEHVVRRGARRDA